MLFDLLRRLMHARTPPAGSAHVPRPADAGRLAEALALYRDGRYAEVIDSCRTLLALSPQDADLLQLTAAAQFRAGKPREALANLLLVLELRPDSAEAHVAAASALAQYGEPARAVEHYRLAVALDPGLGDAWHNLAAMLALLGRYDEAEACARAGLSAGAPAMPLRRTLSRSQFEQGHVDAAIMEARTACALDPGDAMVHSDLVRMLNYADGLDAETIAREHRAWDAAHARSLSSHPVRHANDPDPDRRLRVGFVSPYFRKHAMTFFFESFVGGHDPSRIEVILYSDVERPDDYSERLGRRVAGWRNTVQLDDQDLASMVLADHVDVLVDLSGHTPRNRLLAFARRPAPVQVTWNGYPNTTGMRAMDYRITDHYCDPPGDRDVLHAERLMRLAGPFMTWQPPDDAPDVGPSPALAAGHITFGSFNSCFKVQPTVVALWARILRQVERSRLMVFTVDGEVSAHRIRQLFEAHGTDASRLELLPRMSHEAFLLAHRRVDIALDTFPYHGTTTTCFSLWMGLPVVVLEGTTPASRIGISLLANAGLPELLASDANEYVSIACGLAADPAALERMREGMRRRLLAAPLTDNRAGALALEAGLREMWRAWCTAQHTPR